MVQLDEEGNIEFLRAYGKWRLGDGGSTLRAAVRGRMWGERTAQPHTSMQTVSFETDVQPLEPPLTSIGRKVDHESLL